MAMVVTVGRYRFAAGLIPSVATLLLLPLLIGLGFWQMERAEQKQALLDLYAARAAAAPVVLNGTQTDPAALRYRQVEVMGHFDRSGQMLLDNRIHRGRAGYEVLTPLRLTGSGLAVLVDRGWVSLGASRATPPEAPIPPGLVTVRGVASAPPAQGLMLRTPPSLDATWPVVLNVELRAIEDRLGYTLLPYVILLDPQEPNGFVREWKLFDFGPEKHLAYAFQWFALAAALLVIYVVVNTRRIDRNETGKIRQ